MEDSPPRGPPPRAGAARRPRPREAARRVAVPRPGREVEVRSEEPAPVTAGPPRPARCPRASPRRRRLEADRAAAVAAGEAAAAAVAAEGAGRSAAGRLCPTYPGGDAVGCRP